MKITIGHRDIDRCRKFAECFINAGKSASDFGNSRLQRNSVDKFADVFGGKIGECAFSAICRKKGIDIGIDYSITHGAQGNDNGQDITHINGIPPKKKYDVKSTRLSSKWFLVESHKASERIIKSDVYISIKSDLPSGLESDLSLMPMSEVECWLVGFIYYADLFDKSGGPWFWFKRGERLLNPGFVKYCFDWAEHKYGKIVNRSQLAEFAKGYNGDRYIGPPMKAPMNYGMPMSRLRKAPELFNLLLPKQMTLF